MERFSRRDLLRAGAAGAAVVLAGGAAWDIASGSTPQPLKAGALRDLQKRLKGRVLLPGDPDYMRQSAPANGRYRSVRPIAVAECADEEDVATCTKWVTENGVAPVARGGGHSYAGYSTTTGLLISLRTRLNSVTIDHDHATASCGGAALNQNFYDRTKGGPLFLPGGTCLGVGVGGLALGGGIGYQTHWAGLTSDHMLSSCLVTASGDLLTLSPTENADLFWACRGGAGGNFGINTGFTFSLVEKPKQVTWYRYDWRGADAATAVLDTFNNLIATAPAALNAVAAATAVPVGAGGRREAIEVFSRGQYIGPPDELQDLVKPLLDAAGPPRKTDFRPLDFWDVVTMISSAEPPSHGFGDVSRYVATPIPQTAVVQLVDLLADCPSRSEENNGSIWSLGWVGGPVVDAVGRTDTAYVHRGMSTLLRPTTVWSDDAPASVADGLNGWTKSMIDVIDPFTPNESYQNFPNRMIGEWQQAYYAENFPRLVSVKAKYDPHNLFHNTQSIQVAVS